MKKFNQLNQYLDSTVNINQQAYLYFGGTAYLGMPQNQILKEYYIEGVHKYGLNNGTSRGNNVQLGIYDEVEDYLSKQFGVEAALVISSGYLAASLSVNAYQHFGEIRYAPNCHPAILINNCVEQQNNNFTDWSNQLVEEINASNKQKWLIISNSMNNLYPELYNFTFLDKINMGKQILLIVDDSHGIGILNQGKGILPAIPCQDNIQTIVAASMAKALGIDAGVVLGNQHAISFLKQSNEFYGASPASAAGFYAYMKAEKEYSKALFQLNRNMNFFVNQIENKEKYLYVEDYPVYICFQKNVEQELLKENILISAFPYPDKDGEILNRIVLSSWHHEEQLSHLASIVNKLSALY